MLIEKSVATTHNSKYELRTAGRKHSKPFLTIDAARTPAPTYPFMPAGRSTTLFAPPRDERYCLLTLSVGMIILSLSQVHVLLDAHAKQT